MAENAVSPERLKEEQRRDWDTAAAGWKKWWPLFEQCASHVSERLVELAGVRPGARVLDIATGNGEPALTAARRAAPGGFVIATDQSPGMIAIARERAAAAGAANVEFRQIDGESLDIPERDFDAVVCRWGLMFMPDYAGAVRAIHARLKPGGRFATAVWASADRVPMIAIGAEAVRRIASLPPPPADALGPLRLADESRMRVALSAAGFRDITVERMIVEFVFDSPDDFTQMRVDVSAQFHALLDRVSVDERGRIIAAVTDGARAFVAAGGKVRTRNETICFSAAR
jgi:SAM-dependent methyltransferase